MSSFNCNPQADDSRSTLEVEKPQKRKKNKGS